MKRFLSLFVLMGMFSQAWALDNSYFAIQDYGNVDSSIMVTPVSVLADGEGNIFITETGGNVVKKFTESGEFIDNYLEAGRESGELNAPMEGAISDDIIYIAEVGNKRVTKLRTNGEFAGLIGENDLIGPRSVIVDENNVIHVLDEFDNKIKLFDQDGNKISECSNPYFFMPNDFKYKDGFYYVANTSAMTALKIDQECNLVGMFGEFAVSGTGETHLNYPRGIEIIGDEVYIADTNNHRVVILNSDLGYVDSFGGLGILSGPTSVELLSTGELAVVSSNERVVKIFDIENTDIYTRSIGTPAVEKALLNVPASSDYDRRRNEIYVADYADSAVDVFNGRTGEYKRSLGQFGFGALPGDIFIAAGVKVFEDKVYVTSYLSNEVVVFNRDGDELERFGVTGSDLGQLNGPYDIDIDDNGNIYITEAANGRIQKFDEHWNSLGVVGTPGVGEGKILSPYRIALIDNDSKMLASDVYANKVVKIDLETNEVISEFGSYGTEEGSLFLPFGINASRDGRFVVIGEAGNNRLTYLDKDFNYIGSDGELGTLEDDFFFPVDISPTRGWYNFAIPNRISNKVTNVRVKPCKVLDCEQEFYDILIEWGFLPE